MAEISSALFIVAIGDGLDWSGSFGPLSEGNRAKVRAADADTLLRWGERILTAATVEEVFTG